MNTDQDAPPAPPVTGQTMLMAEVHQTIGSLYLHIQLLTKQVETLRARIRSLGVPEEE